MKKVLMLLCLQGLLLIAADSPKPPALGLLSGVECWNCAPFTARIRLTNYDPTAGPINCWDWHDDYCWSATYSGIPWKAVWGYGAACPIEWPIGTWVDIPLVGRFVCFDRGGLILCDWYETGPNAPPYQLCAVDIMGPSYEWWNGREFTVTLWVPLNPKLK